MKTKLNYKITVAKKNNFARLKENLLIIEKRKEQKNMLYIMGMLLLRKNLKKIKKENYLKLIIYKMIQILLIKNI